jgi:Domain of unknown function (DUF4440)/Domain of unknown function (DUF6265)
MNRLLKASIIVLAGLAPPVTWAADCGSLEELRWLVGSWSAPGEKTSFHETWAALGPHTFEGTGVELSTVDGRVQSGEVLRLVEMAGSVFYVSKVTHNELPVAFRLSECADGRFAFVNPKHDFPRRIEYVRGDDGRLNVHVTDGGKKGFTLEFQRAPEEPAATGPVLAAEDSRFAAMIAANPTEMHRWLAADLEYVHSTGEVETRDQFIKAIVSGEKRFVSVQPTERHVSVLGAGAAVVQGVANFSVMAGPTPLEFEARYLAVYVLGEGAWQLHAWQSMRLP